MAGTKTLAPASLVRILEATMQKGMGTSGMTEKLKEA